MVNLIESAEYGLFCLLGIALGLLWPKCRDVWLRYRILRISRQGKD